MPDIFTKNKKQSQLASTLASPPLEDLGGLLMTIRLYV